MIDLRFDRVSKRYRIQQEDADHPAQHSLVRKLQSLRRRREDFWAVRDVSFEVERGEALGIIGHNGAGKSTILKLLANITAPTSGEITINGRLSALIEVGSGFHPELSGRENVFLSGSILGMRRAEISAKLDSIVEFAGVRQFIDTPVKRYSSGMYVRLGFAIAAHLDPDILLLDEVLAVGDATFQAKCMQRIKELEAAGTTIVFISHDLTAVERVCDRVLLMNKGKIVANGMPRDVINDYKRLGDQLTVAADVNLRSSREWRNLGDSPGDDIARLRNVRVCTEREETAAVVDIRRPVGIEMTYDVLEPEHVLVANYHFFNEAGICAFIVQDSDPEWQHRPKPVGRFISTAWVPGNFLAEGRLAVTVALSSYCPLIVHFSQPEVVSLQVIDSFDGDSARGSYVGSMPGVVRPIFNWTTRSADLGSCIFTSHQKDPCLTSTGAESL